MVHSYQSMTLFSLEISGWASCLMPIALLSTLTPTYVSTASPLRPCQPMHKRLAQHGGVSSTLQWVHLVLQLQENLATPSLIVVYSSMVWAWDHGTKGPTPQACGLPLETVLPGPTTRTMTTPLRQPFFNLRLQAWMPFRWLSSYVFLLLSDFALLGLFLLDLENWPFSD
jgi:hypothetical protein